MPKCLKCAEVFPNWCEIEGKKRNLCKRKYCLDCSPFGQHNTKQLIKNPQTKTCPFCNLEQPLSCYYTRRKNNPSPYCKTCSDRKTQDQSRLIKKQCVDYKGGSCVVCGYDGFVGALEFHHLDPLIKDFTISAKRHSSFENLKKELDKCILLCSRCHKEKHADINKLRLSAMQVDLDENGKYCTDCKNILSMRSFYPKGKKLRHTCKKCEAKSASNRRNEAKKHAIAYKGAGCLVCNYFGCIEALEFHHLDPLQKDFEIGRNLKALDQIKEELDKCILVCSNCHKEIHGGFISSDNYLTSPKIKL